MRPPYTAAARVWGSVLPTTLTRCSAPPRTTQYRRRPYVRQGGRVYRVARIETPRRPRRPAGPLLGPPVVGQLLEAAQSFGGEAPGAGGAQGRRARWRRPGSWLTDHVQ